MMHNKSLYRTQKRNRNRREANRDDPTIVFKNFVRALEKLRANPTRNEQALATVARNKP
jgi:hypothetical protein